MATHIYRTGPVAQKVRRIRRLLLLCTITAFFFLPFWFTNQLYADDQQPDALGAIAGVIQDRTGQPLTGMQVTLWVAQPYMPNSWSVARTVTTQADGSYRFALLPIGVYRVGVTDPQGRYGGRFYPAATVVQQATDLPIAGNTRTAVDLTVEAAGRILGAVTVATPYTAGYIGAELRQRVDSPVGITWEYVQSAGISGSSGVFTFTGLAANTYRICASAYGVQFSAIECYDNVYAIDKATDLTLTSGSTISNVVIVLGDGANFAQIKGRVTNGDGQPLANIDVYALQRVEAGLPQAAATGMWATAKQRSRALLAASNDYGSLHARTNLTGEYQLSTVPAGSYRLQFIDSTGAYAFTYYQNARTASEATVLAVTEKQVIANANSRLAVAGRISGRVSFQNQPAANTNVLAELKLADGTWQAITQTVTNPSTGQYHIGGLPAGTYRISAQATIYDQYNVYQPYGVYGGNTPDNAIEIPVTAGSSATNIDVALYGPRFEGSISGRITADGAPVAGISVALYNSSCCGYQLPAPTIYTFTDAKGNYTFTGLANGAFFLRVSDPTGLYATTYYPDQPSPAQGPLLYTQDEQALTDVNVALTTAGALTGLVQTRAGKAVAGLAVMLTGNDPKLGSYVIIPVDSRTDATGHYTVTGLHPGDYTVCFTGQPYSYTECYGGIEYSYGSYGSQRVTVTAGKTTKNVDVIWGPDLHYYLPFVSQ